MFPFEVALSGLLIVACHLIFLAIKQRNKRRRRTSINYHAHVDERDSVARFRKIMGGSTKE